MLSRRHFLQTASVSAGFAGLAASCRPLFGETPPSSVTSVSGVTSASDEDLTAELPGRWSEARAAAWYAKFPWQCGCNYVASHAVNQIEMWQRSTFNPTIIDAELALAASIGFNTVRIFAHDLVWRTEKEGFFDRVRTFLDLCEKHGISVCYVFFTNGGKAPSVMGPQPFSPGTHNGEWRQTPGVDAVINQPETWDSLKEYVQKTLETFADDPRILFWNIFNEPANNPHAVGTLGFMRKAFQWAREVNPSQPLSSDHQQKKSPILDFMDRNCDLISFHHYGSAKSLEAYIQELKKRNRPVLCTEWMARHLGSTFKDCLPILCEQNVASYCWGLIPGKLQTNIPWTHLVERFPDKKDLWFHDIFRADHTPFDPEEVRLIQSTVQKKNH